MLESEDLHSFVQGDNENIEFICDNPHASIKSFSFHTDLYCYSKTSGQGYADPSPNCIRVDEETA